jgi:hypothetical protein
MLSDNYRDTCNFWSPLQSSLKKKWVKNNILGKSNKKRRVFFLLCAFYLFWNYSSFCVAHSEEFYELYFAKLTINFIFNAILSLIFYLSDF